MSTKMHSPIKRRINQWLNSSKFTQETLQSFISALLYNSHTQRNENIVSREQFIDFFPLLPSWIISKWYTFITQDRTAISKQWLYKKLFVLYFGSWKRKIKFFCEYFNFNNDNKLHSQDLHLIFKHIHYIKSTSVDYGFITGLIDNIFMDNQTMSKQRFIEQIKTNDKCSDLFYIFIYILSTQWFSYSDIQAFAQWFPSSVSLDNEANYNFEDEESNYTLIQPPSPNVFNYLNSNYTGVPNYQNEDSDDNNDEVTNGDDNGDDGIWDEWALFENEVTTTKSNMKIDCALHESISIDTEERETESKTIKNFFCKNRISSGIWLMEACSDQKSTPNNWARQNNIYSFNLSHNNSEGIQRNSFINDLLCEKPTQKSSQNIQPKNTDLKWDCYPENWSYQSKRYKKYEEFSAIVSSGTLTVQNEISSRIYILSKCILIQLYKQVCIIPFSNLYPKVNIDDDKPNHYPIKWVSQDLKSQSINVISLKFENKKLRNKFLRSLLAKMDFRDINEKYVLIDEIGRGEYGRVYLASSRKDKSQFMYAVKVMSKESSNIKLSKMIKNEIEISKVLMYLSHPNIVKCYDIFETVTKVFIVYEYLEYGSLDKAIKQNSLPYVNMISYYNQIAKGVTYLHSFGIMHRDIKPQNIIHSDNSTNIKLIDFGFAKITTYKEKAFETFGSLGYLSPEWLTNSGYNSKIDIWNIGIILFSFWFKFLPYGDCVSSANQKLITEKNIDYILKDINIKKFINNDTPEDRHFQYNNFMKLFYKMKDCLVNEYNDREEWTEIDWLCR